MTAFIAISTMLVLVALAFVLRPLWRESRRTAWALVVALPLLVAGLYLLKGAPGAVDFKPAGPPAPLDQAVAELETATTREPGNLEAWVLLARMRMELQQYPKARDAFAKAHALAPDEPDLMVEFAEAQMRASEDRRFPPAAAHLLEQALEFNPKNQHALLFLGMHQLQGDSPAQAALTWQKLLPLVDVSTAAALLPQINSARALAQLAPLQMPTASSGPMLHITVAITPALASSVPTGAIVFVFALSNDGAGPPLAARRLPVSEFPLQLTLSDGDSVMPTRKLFSTRHVQLMARISASGSALPGPGDIEAEPVLVEIKDGAEVSLVISKIRP